MEWNINLNKYNIILGSESPRRKELLKKMGFKFVVKKAKVKEDFQNFKNIEHAAKAMALLKSNTFEKRLQESQKRFYRTNCKLA